MAWLPLANAMARKREEDIPTMTANAQKDACGLTNPRTMTDKAVMEIYRAAL